MRLTCRQQCNQAPAPRPVNAALCRNDESTLFLQVIWSREPLLAVQGDGETNLTHNSTIQYFTEHACSDDRSTHTHTTACSRMSMVAWIKEQANLTVCMHMIAWAWSKHVIQQEPPILLLHQPVDLLKCRTSAALPLLWQKRGRKAMQCHSERLP
jgi:hypothetical protein